MGLERERVGGNANRVGKGRVGESMDGFLWKGGWKCWEKIVRRLEG
jgi:hypothetical protein